jgi:hypothetical protein
MVKRSSASSPALTTPRPLLLTLGALGLATAVALVAYAVGVPWVGALTVTVPVLLAGGLRASQGWRVLRSRRRIADPWLLWGAEARPAAEILAWRASELTDVRSRKTLARGLRRLRAEAEGRLVPGALPLNRLEIRSQIGLLRALESRLADLGRPVSPRGVLLVEQLLTEPGSPLYARERTERGVRCPRPSSWQRRTGFRAIASQRLRRRPIVLAHVPLRSDWRPLNVRPGRDRDFRCVLCVRVHPDRGLRPRLMGAGDVFGLVVALLILGYLVYALFRGEKL